jgi:hypothetical protein
MHLTCSLAQLCLIFSGVDSSHVLVMGWLHAWLPWVLC